VLPGALAPGCAARLSRTCMTHLFAKRVFHTVLRAIIKIPSRTSTARPHHPTPRLGPSQGFASTRWCHWQLRWGADPDLNSASTRPRLRVQDSCSTNPRPGSARRRVGRERRCERAASSGDFAALSGSLQAGRPAAAPEMYARVARTRCPTADAAACRWRLVSKCTPVSFARPVRA